MAIAPYDPSAGGPSQAAVVDTTAYQNNITDAANRTDLMTQQGRLTNQFQDVQRPQLLSSLGATGQLQGSAGAQAVTQQKLGYENQMSDLQTAFDRAHMDLKRQEAFASIGLIL